VRQERITIPGKKVVVCISFLLIISIIVTVCVQTSLYHLNNTKIIRIGCIGDSITEITIYPGELQRMLGDDYRVGSFGTSGATVLLNTYIPYIYQTSFLRAKVFLPDIVVIMLGTNDARTDHFKSIDNFVADYMSLIREIQKIKSHPQIFLVKPPPLFDNEFYLEDSNLSEGIIPRIEQIAEEQGFPIIDVYSVMEGHPEYFFDGVHPNDEGATVIATQVYNALSLFIEIC
jgi:lysophospholipase L1-like esterase